MIYYLAAYQDKYTKRWRLITREMHAEKKYVIKKIKPYEENGYKTKIIEINM